MLTPTSIRHYVNCFIFEANGGFEPPISGFIE